MKLAKRPTAIWLTIGYAAWELLIKPVLTYNVEQVAVKSGLDVSNVEPGKLQSAIGAMVGHVPNSFGLGFVVGALIFAYWDTFSAWYKARKRPVEKAKPIYLWVGDIDISLEPKRSDRLTIALRLVNLGEGVRVHGITGNVELTYIRGNGGRRKIGLPTPSVDWELTGTDLIEHFHTARVVLHQPLNEEFIREVPDVFTWNPYPSIAFDALNVQVQHPESGEIARLKLWDGLKMSMGDRKIRSDQYIRIFDTPEEAAEFREKIGNLANMLGGKRE